MSTVPGGGQLAAESARAEDLVLRLRDGRQLGYAEYGERAGRPLIALHGTPGARLMLRLADAPARRLGIRLIAPDRPGFGLSDPKPGRRLPDWADDLAELADRLRIARFALVGISGGGPYAAGCASRIPARLTAVGIVGGPGPLADPAVLQTLGPWRRLTVGMVRRAPWLMRPVAAFGGWRWNRDPETELASLYRGLPAADRAILDRPEVRATIVASCREAFRRGGRATVEEFHLFARPWSFRLEEVAVPIRLWHGDADTLVPVGMAHLQARALPHSRLEILNGAGHFWFFDQVEMLLRALCFPGGEPVS